MKKKTAVLTLAALLLVVSANAQSLDNLEISPSSFDVPIDTAGENYTQDFRFTWQGSGEVTVYMESLVEAENTSTEGVTAELERTSYNIESGETVDTSLFIDTSPALKPDNFSFKVKPFLVVNTQTNRVTDVVVRDKNSVSFNKSRYFYLENVVEDGVVNSSEAQKIEEYFRVSNSTLKDTFELNRELQNVTENQTRQINDLQDRLEQVSDSNEELEEDLEKSRGKQDSLRKTVQQYRFVAFLLGLSAAGLLTGFVFLRRKGFELEMPTA